MVTEIVKVFDGIDLESGAAGAPATTWAQPQMWALARDRTLCIAHIEVFKIAGTGATVELVAEDSSGRIFVPLTLASPSTQAKGTFRVVIKDFGAFLKLGIRISGSSATATATVGLEYTLKVT